MTNSENDNRGKFKILAHERTLRLQQPSILYIRRLGWLGAIAINSSEWKCSHILKKEFPELVNEHRNSEH